MSGRAVRQTASRITKRFIFVSDCVGLRKWPSAFTLTASSALLYYFFSAGSAVTSLGAFTNGIWLTICASISVSI